MRYVLLAAILLVSTHANANNCLKLGAIDEQSVRPHINRLVEVLTKAGMCVETVFAPLERNERNFETGVTHVNVGKRAQYESIVEGFASIINVPISEGRGLLVSLGGTVKTIESTHEAGIIVLKGVGWQSDLTTGHPRVHKAQSYGEAIRMVTAERACAMLISNHSWSHYADTHSDLGAIEVKPLTYYIFIRNEVRALFAAPIFEAVSELRRQGDSVTQ